MGWRDLLQTENDTLTLPWVGGRSLRSGVRVWTIEGKLPQEHGWGTFRLRGRVATWVGAAEAPTGVLGHKLRGYIVGDRLVPENARVDPDPARIATCSEQVHLLEPGLDRFVRVQAGRAHEGGPLIYESLEMPLGPEPDVLQAFLDDKTSVAHVPGVTPALDASFRMEAWQRAEAVKRRLEAERLAREEAERLALEDRRRALREKLGDGAGRREMAKFDFGAAVQAALAVGGAQYLDHRDAYNRMEKVVRFRFLQRRFECTCHSQTLQVIDAGICLVDHDTGEKGDAYFTLESLPAVIRQAHTEGKLVVFRHVE
jgi:hypothetical protein